MVMNIRIQERVSLQQGMVKLSVVHFTNYHFLELIANRFFYWVTKHVLVEIYLRIGFFNIYTSPYNGVSS